MKNKTMPIFLVAVLIIAMAIVIKGTMDKKDRKQQDIAHAESIASGSVTSGDTSSEKYEFYQTDPKTGLAAIYTFETTTDISGKGSGSITIDNGGNITKISCAVKKENGNIVFIFAEYEEKNTQNKDLEKGDILVKLHKKEKGLVPEWVSLQSLYPGEEVVRNY